MSVGFFMGIASSYTDEAQESARALTRAINEALKSQAVPPYSDPAEPPGVYADNLFGRSALDHDSARLLVALAELAVNRAGAVHLALLVENPYRVAFLPVELPAPILTTYSESIAGDDTAISIGSSLALLREVIAVAPLLGIPLKNGVLSDPVAALINDYAALFPGDTPDPNADQRTTWLLLHEGARLSIAHRVALSLAG